MDASLCVDTNEIPLFKIYIAHFCYQKDIGRWVVSLGRQPAEKISAGPYG